MIPSTLWNKLAPEIKKAIMDTRKKIYQESNSKPASSSLSPPKSGGNVPRQYPNAARVNRVQQQDEDVRKMNLLKTHDQLVSHGLLYEDSSETSDSYSSDINV